MTLSIYEQAKKTHKKFRMYKETTLLKGRKKKQKSNNETPKKIAPKNNKMFFKEFDMHFCMQLLEKLHHETLVFKKNKQLQYAH